MVGMNSAGVDAEAEALRAKEPLAQVPLRSPVASMLKAGGHLRWRILMIVVVLASVAVPLRTALLQVSAPARYVLGWTTRRAGPCAGSSASSR